MSSLSQLAFDFETVEPLTPPVKVPRPWRRRGEMRPCEVCGVEFYVSRAKLESTRYRAGSYCSRSCMGEARKGKPGWTARPDEKLLHSAGYVLVWAPDHPRASRCRVFEHILVMEAKLGRFLEPGEFVHHKDRNRLNNDPANLELVSNSDHGKLHADDIRARCFTQVELACQECGTVFSVKRSRALATNPQNQRKYCGEACRAVAWGRQMHAKRREKLGY